MDATLPPRLPFEMFHGIRDIDLLAIDAGSLERLIENFSSGPDEWTPLYVFLIPRLFSDEHHSRLRSTLAENRLRSQLPEITRLTAGGDRA